MALKKTTTKSVCGQELTFHNSYNKIVYVAGNKENVDFTLATLDENQEYTINEESYSFVPNIAENSQNFIKQGYEYLKSLPEFVGAVDV